VESLGSNFVNATAARFLGVKSLANGSSEASPATGNFMRPSYIITVGSEEFSLDNESKVISVRVDRNIGLPTDRCEVCLVGSEDYAFKKNDPMKAQLGYDDEMETVFSGLVENISYEVNKIIVTALGVAAELLRLRFNRIYHNQTAGKIVSDIAKEANVKIKTASDGINFPTYIVDDATNAYEHILKLAERCNFDVYITEDEQLVFKEREDGKNFSILFGQEIIKLSAFDYSPLYTSTNIFGESPSSVKGSDTYHWLTKQDVKGEAGRGAVLWINDPAIRDKKTAETVAKARMEKLQYNFGLAVEVVGKPQIKLGDTITLEDIPNSALQGQLEVRGFEHYLSKNTGFTTIINCWKRS
jgi:phage protein D